MDSEVKNLLSIITTAENERLSVSSKHVAEKFNKRHDDVLKALKNLKRNLGDEPFWNFNFAENKIKTLRKNDEELAEILMTKDGFVLLTMGFTGKEALDWKVRFIEAFNYLADFTLRKLKEEKTEHEKFRLAFEEKEKLYLEHANYLANEVAILAANQKKKRKKKAEKRMLAPVLQIDLFGHINFKWAQKLNKEEAAFWQWRISLAVQMMLAMNGMKMRVEKEILQAVKDFRHQFKETAIEASDAELVKMFSEIVVNGVKKFSETKIKQASLR